MDVVLWRDIDLTIPTYPGKPLDNLLEESWRFDCTSRRVGPGDVVSTRENIFFTYTEIFRLPLRSVVGVVFDSRWRR